MSKGGSWKVLSMEMVLSRVVGCRMAGCWGGSVYGKGSVYVSWVAGWMTVWELCQGSRVRGYVAVGEVLSVGWVLSQGRGFRIGGCRGALVNG